MSDQTFIHLHVHTEFSLLDGLSQIKKLVKRAKELKMPALAITDHGTMFGVMDFYNACKEEGIKPIIGVEAYLAPRGMEDRDPVLDKRPYHLLLLAQNRTGYQNLLKLSTEAQLRGYYYRPRVDWDFLAQHTEGIIATSGCLAAKIPALVTSGQEDKARETVGDFVDLFGPDNFYLELQHHDIPEIHGLNKWLVDYNRSHHTNVGLVATNDVHYVMETDYEAHDTLLCIQTGSMKSESKDKRLAMTDNSYFLSSSQQMWQLFGEVPEAITNSQKIADMCDLHLEKADYHLPVFPVPPGHDGASYLRYLCQKGLAWRYGSRHTDDALRARLDRELYIINDMGFNSYFLIVWDLCEFARHADIWWNVRGSGAGSLVAYCLGITNIDPIHNNLLFERFLNPGRVTMPDIDLDYPDDRRGDMIAYTARKYGEDKVAAIITFGTMGAKAAVRDVGRVLEVPLSDINRAVALIPTEAKQKSLEAYVESNPDLQKLYDSDASLRHVIDTAKALQGTVRHASQHAAGVIVADKPLVEYLPLHRLTGKDSSGGALKAVTQFPMETCEAIGLLKIDFLGLSTLTILRKACELIEQHHGIRYTMDNIPYRHDDPNLTDKDRADLDKAFEIIGRGETVGIFQVESSGMQQMLRDMRPHKFENIIAAVSLYRPGPMDFIPQYNRRLRGEEQPEYRHPRLESILKETYGIIVYQEQIMQIAGELFGYELGEADTMRRAVSKKKDKDLAEHRGKFLKNAPHNGIDDEAANKIFDDIEFFANYGFNKSHAADYAVITVQTAFLKTHYPEEYMAALLTVHRDDSGKVGHFLEECRRLNIAIFPPDVNYSALEFDIHPDPATGQRGIRFGLAAVKNAGTNALEALIEARRRDGGFADLEDLCRRVDLRLVGKRTLESLIKVGALTAFGTRAQLLAGLDRMMAFSTNYHKDQEIGQMNMFGEAVGFSDGLLGNLPNVAEVTPREMLAWEKELLGLYVTGRPADKYKDELRQSNTAAIADLKEYGAETHDKTVSVAGEIIALRSIYTKRGEQMAVIQLEDWHESAAAIEIVLFPRTWKMVQELVDSGELRGFEEGEVVRVTGKFDISRGDAQIIADSVSQNFSIMTMDDTFSTGVSNYDTPAWAVDAPPFAPEDDDAPAWPDEDMRVGLPPAAAAVDTYTDGAQAETHTPDAANGNHAAPDAPPAKAELAPYSALVSRRDDDLPPWATGGEAGSLSMDEEPAAPRWVEVHLIRSDEADRDLRRLKRLYRLLVSYPGQDHFRFVIHGPGSAVRVVNYPNRTTSYCEELIADLVKVVGSESNIRLLDSE